MRKPFLFRDYPGKSEASEARSVRKIVNSYVNVFVYAVNKNGREVDERKKSGQRNGQK